jgi:hypothetical protein
MKRLLGFLLCASFIVGHADTTLNTQGLPEGAVGVIEFNLSTFNDTKFGRAIKDAIPENQDAALLQQELGLDPSTDIKEFVVGVYAGPDGKVSQKEPLVAGLIRGNFQPKQIQSFAESNGLRGKDIGGFKSWDVNDIQRALGEQPAKNSPNMSVLTGSTNAIGFASNSLLTATTQALQNPAATVQLPAGTEAYLKSAQKPWAFIALDGSKMEESAKAGVKTITVVAGESTTDVQIGIYLQFKSKDLASDLTNKVKGLLMMATMAMPTSEDGKSADQISQQRLMTDLVQAIKIDNHDDLVSINFNFPIDKAVDAIKKAIDKAQVGQTSTPVLKVKKK